MTQVREDESNDQETHHDSNLLRTTLDPRNRISTYTQTPPVLILDSSCMEERVSFFVNEPQKEFIEIIRKLRTHYDILPKTVDFVVFGDDQRLTMELGSFSRTKTDEHCFEIPLFCLCSHLQQDAFHIKMAIHSIHFVE